MSAERKTPWTPGPWRLVKRDIEAGLAVLIAQVYPNPTRDRPTKRWMVSQPSTADANARLIAAAPEMADLIRRVAEHFSETDAPLGDEAMAILKRIGAP